MAALDRLIPNPRLLEIDRLDVGGPAKRVWEALRHEDLPQSRTVRALFAIRTLVTRTRSGHSSPAAIRLDAMTSSLEHPGFQILVDHPPREVAVGAIGKVWRLDIPFVHVAGADEFARFAEPGFVKVAWALRVIPLGDHGSRLQLELRVAATDESSWRRFWRYFRLIGPGSRFSRRSLLRAFGRRFGRPVPVGTVRADAGRSSAA
jgi:hypothetical protein